LLVGGFGESGYLYDRIEQAYKKQKIAVLQAAGAWSSICRGATMWGLENSSKALVLYPPTVSSRIARYSYGISLDHDFDATKHLEVDKFWYDVDGTWSARNQMSWLITRGTKISNGIVLTMVVHDNVSPSSQGDAKSRNFSCDLCYCEKDTPAKRHADKSVKMLCTVHWTIDWDSLHRCTKFTSPCTGEKWLSCAFEVRITLGNANLTFEAYFDGKIVGRCSTTYPDP